MRARCRILPRRRGGLAGTLRRRIHQSPGGAVVFVVAGWLSDAERAPLGAGEAPSPTGPGPHNAALVRRTLFVVAAGTAVASFIYEIAGCAAFARPWERNDTFELMLSAFILGLALGAWWVRSAPTRFATAAHPRSRTRVMGVMGARDRPLYLLSFRWTAGLLECSTAQRRIHRVQHGALRFCTDRDDPRHVLRGNDAPSHYTHGDGGRGG